MTAILRNTINRFKDKVEWFPKHLVVSRLRRSLTHSSREAKGSMCLRMCVSVIITQIWMQGRNLEVQSFWLEMLLG